MMSALKRPVTFLLCFVTLLVLSLGSAWANNIVKLRAFSNNDKTRVVVDLDYKAHYSTAMNKNGREFVLRVNNVGNQKSAPQNLSVEGRSVIKDMKRNLSGSDVRYIFTLDGSGTPNVFMLNPMNGQNYRLVLDFPHTASARAPVTGGKVEVISQSEAKSLKGTGQGAGVPPTKVITLKDADNAESALLNSLSTVGSDGIRTMTPAQAEMYQQRLEQLHREYEAARRENLHSSTTAAAPSKPTPSSRVEEEVLDTQAPPPPAPMQMPEAHPYIIAIDAGHGGKDPGAIGTRGVKEKNVTLAIATQLARYVNSNARFRGKLIRDKDVFVDLDKRSEIARQYKADILISIHADSVASGSSARGASIWVLSTNRAERENSKMLKNDNQNKLLGGTGEVLNSIDSSTDKQNPYLAATILAMSSDNNRSEGYTIGQEILDKLGKFTKLHKSTPIHASLAVLKSPDIPSLLIETGFLSNKYEEIQLNQPNYQKQIAYCIYQGIVSYYEKYTVQRIKTRYESAVRTGSMPAPRTHVVKKGESLSVIAQKYNRTVKQIKAANSMSKDSIYVGQKIIIP